MLLKWYRLKNKEIEVKMKLLNSLDDASDIIEFIGNTAKATKGMDGTELVNKVIEAIAEKVHSENK